MNLLSTLRERIERADALVMDLAGHNPNVLIEVGMAVAMHKGESGALIILKPKNESWPSNLQDSAVVSRFVQTRTRPSSSA